MSIVNAIRSELMAHAGKGGGSYFHDPINEKGRPAGLPQLMVCIISGPSKGNLTNKKVRTNPPISKNINPINL